MVKGNTQTKATAKNWNPNVIRTTKHSPFPPTQKNNTKKELN
jgi:hypothetical protein